jgi:hypothetical protein
MNPRREVEEVEKDAADCLGCEASKRAVEDVRAENMRLNMLLKEQHEVSYGLVSTFLPQSALTVLLDGRRFCR